MPACSWPQWTRFLRKVSRARTKIGVIRHVHISENDRGTAARRHMPCAETFKALRAGGYDGWLTIEAFGRTLPELAATTCVWRDLSGSDEEVYVEGLRLIREGWATDGTSAGTSAGTSVA